MKTLAFNHSLSAQSPPRQVGTKGSTLMKDQHRSSKVDSLRVECVFCVCEFHTYDHTLLPAHRWQLSVFAIHLLLSLDFFIPHRYFFAWLLSQFSFPFFSGSPTLPPVHHRISILLRSLSSDVVSSEGGDAESFIPTRKTETGGVYWDRGADGRETFSLRLR